MAKKKNRQPVRTARSAASGTSARPIHYASSFGGGARDSDDAENAGRLNIPGLKGTMTQSASRSRA
ncbi:hypothetical protein ACYULU_06065 [Breznakiellaceae bacterium SP9]